ncbi:CDP-alcohol phosphatidyltransferase family protein [Kineosporia sp. A_224]|uniref:CDP-alcohol phosphatidyltransferase family protein n=1 Tax=Kineosporia sp. A_224 TaxID=1962180 RepID=UPI000B4B7974|nr:CDP-alcohol phosphatidyltransferase family protein [Kineosporia sp. A_224]
MTRLVVVGAGDGGSQALADQARGARVPVGTVESATDLDALRTSLRAASASGEPAALVAADLVVHPSLLGDTFDDPRRAVAALVLDDGRLGALRLDPAAAVAAAEHLPGPGPAGTPAPDGLDAVLGALTAAGTPVVRVTPGLLVARRPGWAPEDRDAAFDVLAATSEHTARLDGAARPADGLYSTFVVRRLSRRLTPVALRLGMSPNLVTSVSLVVGLLAAGLLTSPAVLPRVLGAVLLQLSLVIDCVDGEIARYARRFTPLGAWLDGVSDRVKEYATLAALAVAAGGRTGWLLALGGVLVLTYRHVADHQFMERLKAAAPPPAPGLAPAVHVERETPVVWVRRVLQFGVGERWILLGTVVVLAGQTAALAAYLAAAVVSAVWTTGGRVLRSRAFAGTAAGQVSWLVPALGWVLEAAVVAGAFLWRADDRLWLGYCLLAVVAYHGYDEVYREKYRVPGAPRIVRVVALGPYGRAAVVALAATGGGTALTGVVAVLTVVLALLFGGESLDAWMRWLRARPSMEEEQ